MGYEMYRLLNFATEPNVKTKTKKPKATNNDDEDSSSTDEKIWKKKATKSKADLAEIEKYRQCNILSTYRRKKDFFLCRKISTFTRSRFNSL
jgi:hypothetical protein